MPYIVTFTINIPPMLAYIPYMDPMGNDIPTVDGSKRYFLTGAVRSPGRFHLRPISGRGSSSPHSAMPRAPAMNYEITKNNGGPMVANMVSTIW